MTRTSFQGALALASALLLDAIRRPGPWLAAGGCAFALMACSLLLPVSDPSDLPKFTASFCAGVLLLGCFLSGAAAPAAMISSARQEGFQTFGWSMPRGRTAMTAGLFLSSGAIVAAFTAFLALLQFCAIGAACALSPAGASGIAPRQEYFPEGPGCETMLSPGVEKTFRFAPVKKLLLEGTSVDCEIETGLLVARPEEEAAGAPFSVRVRASGAADFSHDFPSAARGRVVFEIPAETALRGFELVLSQGPSPYDIRIPRGGVVVKGGEVSMLPGFLVSACGIMVMALMLAALSAAGSCFMSLPFAVVFSAGIGLAILLAPEALEATRDIEKAGLAGARYGGLKAPSWGPGLRMAIELLMTVFPDAGRLNPSSLFSAGRQVPGLDTAAEGAKGLALAAAAAVSALLLGRRCEDKQ